MPFLVILPIRPRSLQGAGKKRFQAELKATVGELYKDLPKLEGWLYSRIIWFHSQAVTNDVDNIIKSIHDALEGIVYLDDFYIAHCTVRRIDLILTETYDLLGRGISDADFDELTRLIYSEEKHVLYVKIDQLTNKQVAYGPIDGESR